VNSIRRICIYLLDPAPKSVFFGLEENGRFRMFSLSSLFRGGAFLLWPNSDRVMWWRNSPIQAEMEEILLLIPGGGFGVRARGAALLSLATELRASLRSDP
jgi:hypothetical protein